ncbi:putative O-methyltransferase [Saccharata proteae CBS 121410]|uniref:O-methyltransferase n=1 Tax=Saccharata proteae CBS 121410 TaxID=1314787 RepID=A0A9P4LU99_9PEZI|nr:putative O-methyltransferase [Saccharata proteae CBS 121410]
MGKFTDLAESILADARVLDEHLSSDLSGPTAYTPLSADVQSRRYNVIDATQKLRQLALGPKKTIIDKAIAHADLLSLRFIHRYNIPSFLPDPDSTVSFREIAQATKLPLPALTHIIQNAIVQGFFTEPEPGILANSPLSMYLAKTPGAVALLGFWTEEVLRASTKALEALEKWPDNDDVTHTGFNLAFDTPDPFFAELAKEENKARNARIGQVFGFMARNDVVANHPYWQGIDKPNTVVVDVGGNRGHVSKAIANRTKHLTFVVQDLAGPVALGREELQEELRERFEFKVHNFFEAQPQPVAGVRTVFMLGRVLHDWGDSDCVRILRNLVQGMGEDSEIVVVDRVLPDAAREGWVQRIPRGIDLIMQVLFNARERTTDEWVRLFRSADESFDISIVCSEKGTSEFFRATIGSGKVETSEAKALSSW